MMEQGNKFNPWNFNNRVEYMREYFKDDAHVAVVAYDGFMDTNIYHLGEVITADEIAAVGEQVLPVGVEEFYVGDYGTAETLRQLGVTHVMDLEAGDHPMPIDDYLAWSMASTRP